MSTPSAIYVPVSIGVQNPNFEDNPPSFPSGWVSGGTGLNTSYGYVYDTTSQYEGTASFIINASVAMGGISQNLGKVSPGETYKVTAALRTLTTGAVGVCRVIFLDSSGNQVVGPSSLLSYAPSAVDDIAVHSAAWVLLSGVGTVPLGAVTMELQIYLSSAGGGTCEFDAISVTRTSSSMSYYLSLVPSQYQGASNFKNLLMLLMQPLADLGICASAMNEAFSVDAAEGTQLDVLGEILGAARELPFDPVGVSTTTTAAISSTGAQSVTTAGTQYMDTLTALTIDSGGNAEVVIPTAVTQGVGFSANFTKTHLSGVAVVGAAPSQVLGDEDYRTLLKGRILWNQWDGLADSLWQPWQSLFPGGSIYITDNQNMTATIFLIGSFSSIVQQMITNGLIVPRPEGVEYTYSFAALPIFGFGNENPALIQGFGDGTGAYPGGNWA